MFSSIKTILGFSARNFYEIGISSSIRFQKLIKE